jgi:dATP pyrophosphohydrolase
VREETGIDAAPERFRRWPVAYTFEVYPEWRHRFVAGTLHNTEHVFSLEVPVAGPVVLAPQEHTAAMWLPWPEAAAKCFSWSNRDAIQMLASRA